MQWQLDAIYVFAIQNIGFEEKSSSPLWINSTKGVGENPIGRTADATMANVKIFFYFDSSSNKSKIQNDKLFANILHIKFNLNTISIKIKTEVNVTTISCCFLLETKTC